MKSILTLSLFLISFCTSFSAFSQQNHFIYIQSEPKTAFYVKMGDKVLSSSASGYLIISKLESGIYRMGVGFPKDQWPEQILSVAVDTKDEGLVLKNFGEKGWGFFNMRSLAVTMPGEMPAKEPEVPKEIKNDAFSNMLADAVDDSTIREKDVVKAETTPVKPAEKTDVKTEEVKSETKTEEETTGKGITRTLMKAGKDGVDMVFVDESSKKKDTIRLFVPVEKAIAVKEEPKVDEAKVAAEKAKQEQAALDLAKEVEERKRIENLSKKQEDKVVEPVAAAPVENKTEIAPVVKEEKTTSGAVMVNSDCKKVANEEDYLKLRKKLAGETTNSELLDLARKAFKSRCFTTDQIKKLSGLFPDDEGRYQFFDAAYPFLYDTDNVRLLESQLSDAYYINRFRAMIKK